MGKNEDVERKNFQYKQQQQQSSKSDYIKRHLYFKCCVNRNSKVTIRNYTPKIISQEINMGMWM